MSRTPETICMFLLLMLNCEAKSHSESKEGANHKKPLQSDPLIVETKSGLIRGYSKFVLNHEVHAFTGIPFAKPPTGPLRFRKPVPVEPWEGILNATKLPNSCYQENYDYFPGFEGEEMWNANTELSEDCLYLSIWVPQKLRIRHHGDTGENVKKPKIPVFIWIYGGGYISGTSTLDVYTSDIMAAYNNAIVAAMQYRVGAFGFLFLTPELPSSNGDAPGNMGLWDQALAIRWIKDNIQAFGGDPEHITLFGESAGAGSVSAHLISPVSRGLATRGILQSGTLNAPWSFMTGEKALQIGLTLVDDCGCNSSLIEENPSRVMSCMRTVDAKTISKRQWNSYWGILGFPSAPTIDGVFLPKDPLDMVREGNFSDTEIIIGSNLNEGTFFLLYDFIDYFDKHDSSSLVRDKFLEIVNTIFKEFSQLEKDAIIFQYTDWENVNDGYLNQKVLGDLVGDYFFVCPTNLFSNLFAEQGGKVYYYFFTQISNDTIFDWSALNDLFEPRAESTPNHENSTIDPVENSVNVRDSTIDPIENSMNVEDSSIDQRTSSHPWGDWMGVIHGDEIAYVFGQPLNLSMNYNARERDLSMRIMQAFSRFSVSGKPVAEESEWPRYTKESPVYYIYDAVNVGHGKGPRSTACEFWNGLMPEVQQFAEMSMKGCGLVKDFEMDGNVTRSNSRCLEVNSILLTGAVYALTSYSYLFLVSL